MSRYAEFQINYEEMLRLEDRMMKYSGDAEEAVNNVIHDRGAKLIVMNILGFMPMGKGPGPHANATENSIKVFRSNLRASFIEGDKFGYLIFPEMGLGRRNPVEKAFFLEGVEKSHEVIMEWIIEALEYTPLL